MPTREETAELGNRSGSYPVVWNLDDLASWEAQHRLLAPEHGAWWRVLEHHVGLFNDWVSYMNDGWAVGLPEHLIDPAWATLYLTTTSSAGMVSVFIGGGDEDRDPLHPNDPIDPDGLILERLQNLGLVSLHGGDPYPVMLRIEHKLGSIRWDTTVRQPATWAEPAEAHSR